MRVLIPTIQGQDLGLYQAVRPRRARRQAFLDHSHFVLLFHPVMQDFSKALKTLFSYAKIWACGRSNTKNCGTAYRLRVYGRVPRTEHTALWQLGTYKLCWLRSSQLLWVCTMVGPSVNAHGICRDPRASRIAKHSGASTGWSCTCDEMRKWPAVRLFPIRRSLLHCHHGLACAACTCNSFKLLCVEPSEGSHLRIARAASNLPWSCLLCSCEPSQVTGK